MVVVIRKEVRDAVGIGKSAVLVEWNRQWAVSGSYEHCPASAGIMPEKILYHSVTILNFGRQEQDFRFIFLGSRGWLLVRHRLSRENFHGFYEVIFLDLDEIIEGRIAAETSRPPIPFAVGNL